jgi:hypothetical protein
VQQRQNDNSQEIAAAIAVPTIDNNFQSPIPEAVSTLAGSQAAVSFTDGQRGRHEDPISIFSHDLHSTGPLFGLWSQSYHLDAHYLQENSALYDLDDAALSESQFLSQGPDWMTMPLQDRVEEVPRDSSPIPIGDDGGSAEDMSQAQIVSTPESSRLREIHHVSSSLSTYFFQDVLPRYCTWDSNSSIIRIIIQAMW